MERKVEIEREGERGRELQLLLADERLPILLADEPGS
jgi:hypothetical protein